MPGSDGERSVAVGELLGEGGAHLRLKLRAGEHGLANRIHHPRVQKAALAVSGHVESVRPGRVQVLGSSEIQYLSSRAPRRRAMVFRKICASPVTCFIVSGGHEPPGELLAEAEVHSIPVLTTDLLSSVLIDQIQRFLDDHLAPRTSVHGNLVDVYGLGVLLLGQSGIGKSECALDLVTRGHRLVADDVVDIRREDGVLVGSGPDLGRYHMEIRGIGLINIRDLFGISAIRSRKFIELVVLLEPWAAGKPYDRLGLEDASYTILDVELPLVRMPVVPGRNLAILIEVAARNQLLKLRGFHAARAFVARMTKEMEARSGVGGDAPGAGAALEDGHGEREPREGGVGEGSGEEPSRL